MLPDASKARSRAVRRVSRGSTSTSTSSPVKMKTSVKVKQLPPIKYLKASKPTKAVPSAVEAHVNVIVDDCQPEPKKCPECGSLAILTYPSDKSGPLQAFLAAYDPFGNGIPWCARG